MRAHVRGSLLLALLARLLAPGFTASAEYVPTPILEVGKPWLEDIAYSPDGRVLATLTTDWIELLDAETFEPVARFGLGGTEIEYSPDGSEIAVFYPARPARIYDAATGTLKEEIAVGRFAHAFSPDWRRLAYSEGDIVYVWDRDAQAATATLTGDPEPGLLQVHTQNGTTTASALRVGYLAFHPDGIGLLVVSHRRTVGFWDSFSGELIRHYQIGRTWVRDIAVRHDGTEFAAFTSHGENLVWRFDDPEPTTVQAAPTLGSMWAQAYDAGGGLWLTGYDSLHRLNTDDGTISTARMRLAPPVEPHEALLPLSLTFDVSRGRVATMIEDRIAIWSVEGVRLERLVDHAWGVGSRNAASAVYVPGRGRVVTFGRATRRWDDTLGDVFQTQEFPADIDAVAATDDGTVTALQLLYEVRVYRTSTGQHLSTIGWQRGWRLAISRSGRYLAIWDHRMTIWSATNGQRLATLPTGRPQGLAFTPSGRRLVVRTEPPETLQVWDIAEKALMMTIPDGGPFAATPSGIIHIVRHRGQYEVRQVGAGAP
ncbi:WD40 repeat domain-containing protein, partial [Candidatus Poribacteria bacterium]|nr:WD40 repeat domain-containing protein [Candidatus Poribacteria bacterium]